MVRVVCARPVGGYRGYTRGERDGLSDAVCLYPSIGRMGISTDKSMAYTYGEVAIETNSSVSGVIVGSV